MPMIPVDTAVQLIVGPLVDDTDFKTLETGVAHNAAGMSVDFIKSSISGTPTKTDITLTTGSTQDWVELGNGMYYIEITAAQNDTEGEVQLVGVATGILPFASPRYQVVSQQVYNSLVAGSDTLNAAVTEWNGVALATTNPLPNAAPDAAGGLPVSDAGGLDLDGLNTNVSAILTDTGTAGVVVDWSAIVNPTATKSFTNTTVAVTSAVASGVTVTTNNDKTGYSISGTLTTLDALDTAQDSQHATTQSNIAALNDVAATDIVSGGAITTSGGAVSTVTSVTNAVAANVTQISGSATAADNLEASALGIVPGAVNDASATTTSFVSNLTEATDDHYNGRIIVFTSGAVAGQATDITDYNGTTKAITMTALTEAPANSVTFVIV